MEIGTAGTDVYGDGRGWREEKKADGLPGRPLPRPVTW